MAAIQLTQGHADAARRLITEVLQKNPRDDDALILRSTIEMQQNDPTGAIGDLRAVLRNQPNSVALQRTLAAAYLAKGQPALAEEALRAALEQDPQNVELLNLLGGLYFELKDFDHAAGMFARASALNPRLWQPHRNLALVKVAANDPDGAVSEYQTALKLAPAEPQLVADAARLYEKQGRIDAAIAGYEALYQTNPQVRQFAANNLAMLLVTYKKDEASLDRARDLTSNFVTSGNGMLLDTVGWVRFKRGEYQDALPTLERAMEQAPDSKLIRFHLAMTQLRLGLRDRARTNLEAALMGSDNFEGADEARTVLASLKARA